MVSRKLPGWVIRLLAAPTYVYDWNAGWLLGRRFVRLTHRGRRSGRVYRTMLEVVGEDRATGEVFVIAGLGRSAQWYQNVRTDHAMEIRDRSRALPSVYPRDWPRRGRQRARRVRATKSTDRSCAAAGVEPAGGMVLRRFASCSTATGDRAAAGRVSTLDVASDAPASSPHSDCRGPFKRERRPVGERRGLPGPIPSSEMRSQVDARLRQFAFVTAIRDAARGKPLLGQCATVGVVVGLVLGGVAGLIIGLVVHAATAWFAVFELGVPAGIAGGLVGCVAALIVMAGRRLKRGTTPSA
jgi:deazaflavin-dependent oxidoreductase (nitroreductase family)